MEGANALMRTRRGDAVLGLDICDEAEWVFCIFWVDLAGVAVEHVQRWVSIMSYYVVHEGRGLWITKDTDQIGGRPGDGIIFFART